MTAKCNQDRLTVERIAARSFVVLGGLFWVIATFSAERVFRGGSDLISARNALLPLALTVIVFVIGMFWEYAVSALLAATSAGVLAWGFYAGWEPGVWMLMIATLVAPMIISGPLYFLAARMQRVCTLERQTTAKEAPAGAATQ